MSLGAAVSGARHDSVDYCFCVFVSKIGQTDCFCMFFPKQLVCWGSIGLSRIGSCHEMILPWPTLSPTLSPLCLPLFLPLCLPQLCEILSRHGSGFVSHFFSLCVSHCSVRSCQEMDLALSPTVSPTPL